MNSSAKKDSSIQPELSCHFCGKNYKIAEYLKRHERTHTTGMQTVLNCVPKIMTPSKCKICGKLYASDKGLAKHMISHEQDTAFRWTTYEKLIAKKQKLQCENCGESFKTGDIHICSITSTQQNMDREYVVDLKDICINRNSEISCTTCKRNFLNDECKAVHWCKTSDDIVKIFETVERLVSKSAEDVKCCSSLSMNVESAGINKNVEWPISNGTEDVKSHSTVTKNAGSAGMNKSDGVLPIESDTCQIKSSVVGKIQRKDTGAPKLEIWVGKTKKRGVGDIRKKSEKASKSCKRTVEPSSHSLNEFTSSPQVTDALGRWPKIVEVKDKGKTDVSRSELLDIFENETMLVEYESDLMAVHGKNVANSLEDTIMQEIIHIKEEIDKTVC